MLRRRFRRIIPRKHYSFAGQLEKVVSISQAQSTNKVLYSSPISRSRLRLPDADYYLISRQVYYYSLCAAIPLMMFQATPGSGLSFTADYRHASQMLRAIIAHFE